MSGSARIVQDPHASAEKRQIVRDGVDLHNVAATGCDEYHPVATFLEGDGGEVLGGLLGAVWGGWLQIDFVWVTQRLRGQGHARALLEAAESYARERGARAVHLSTSSFQALAFYEKQGYEPFGRLDDYPPGHAHFYLRKRL
jgi:GNAT superfamily N-acetyltransferase